MNSNLEDLQTNRENTQKQNIFKESKFKISAKNLFLTYSKVDTKITAEHVLKQLQNNFYGFTYIVSNIINIDGQVYFHVLLINKNKFHIQNAERLYIEFNGKNFHGNYQLVKYLPQVVEYVCKDKHYAKLTR